MKDGIMYSAILLLLLTLPAVQADAGPKPTADFYVTYAGGNVSDGYFYAVMLSCTPDDGSASYHGMSDYAPMLNLTLPDSELNCSWRPGVMAWSDSNNGMGNCHNSRCSFRYNPPHTFRLAVYLPGLNATFITPAADRNAFNSRFLVSLNPDGSSAIVETTVFEEAGISETLLWFIPAAVITFVVELLFGLLLALLAKFDLKRFLLSIFIANFLSLPAVWFIFPLLRNPLLVVPLAECFTVAFEAAVIYAFARRAITPLKALLASVILNAASVLAGIVLLLPFWLLLKLFF
ncbi:MAG: hypothetical protein PHG85_01885 [Candidatus Altiarchaeota archaeon]|nr:hypothetical protein [Candidatus Altiarchaeota archaeon]